MESKKVVIVGAGIGGLAAAYLLSRKGYEVEVLESSDRPGGRMQTLERKGIRIDVGAQFFHSNYRHTIELLDAVNLSGSKRAIKGKVQFMLEDQSTYLYDHRIPYMKVLGLRGNLKLYGLFLKYVVFGRRFPLYEITRDIPEYDNTSVEGLFKAPSDQVLRDYLVTPMCMQHPDEMSLYSFVQAFRYNAFTGFLTLSGGIASLPAKLAERLPVRYEAPVRQLVMEKGRVAGVQMEKDGSIRKAGHVVVAAEPPAMGRLMPAELEEQRRFFESVVPAPLPMPVLFLDRPLRRDVWCYFNYPGLKRAYLFAIDQYAKAPEMCSDGKSVLTAWLSDPERTDLIDRPDTEVLKTAREDLERMVPGVSNWIEDAMVVRHPYHVAQYPLGTYRRILDFIEGAKRLKGVSFVSDYFGTSCFEGAVISAERAVQRIVNDGGDGT